MHPCDNCAYAQRKRNKFFKLLNWCRLYRKTVEVKCIDWRAAK